MLPVLMYTKVKISTCCTPRAPHHGIQDLWRQQVVLLLLILFKLLPKAARLLLPGDMLCLGCPLRICMRISHWSQIEQGL